MAKLLRLLPLAFALTFDEINERKEKLFSALSSGAGAEKVRELLVGLASDEKGEKIDANAFTNEYGESVLHIAAISENVKLETIMMLVNEYNADVNLETTGDYKRTPTMWFLINQSPEKDAILKFLVAEQGADAENKLAEDGTSAVKQCETMGMSDLGEKLKLWQSQYKKKREEL